MDPKELRSLYGRRCRAVVHCRGCSRAHTMTGTLTPGRRAGDVMLEGLTLPVSDLISIRGEPPILGARFSLRPALPYLWLAWALLAWLMALAHR